MRARHQRAKEKAKRGGDGPTKDDLDRWRWLMDPDQVDPQQFQELVFEVKDTTSHAGRDDDDDEEGAARAVYTPFKDREAQSRLWLNVAEQWDAGKAAKVINLKARQHGISTKVQAMLAERVSRHIGDGTTVCQDDDSTLEMFSKLREFLSQIPDWALPDVIKDRERVVRFDHGHGRTSSVRMLTAGKHSLGRSLMNNWLHISEFPFWPGPAKKQLPGLLKTLHNLPGNFAVLEFTANGYEQAYKRWKKALKGKGGWTPQFYSWLIHPEYYIPFASPEERAEFEKSVGRKAAYGGEEEIVLLRDHGASLENLHFRREEIDGDLEGNLDLFHQEFPTIWEEAFISTGRPVLLPDILRTWLKLAEEKTERAEVGDLIVENEGYKHAAVKFVPNRRGMWTVFQKPVVGQAYCFGSDVAGEYEVYADGSAESDKTVVDILHLHTGTTVARFRGNMISDDFAHEVLKGAVLYGAAMGHVERNQDGGTAIGNIERKTIGDVDGEEILLYRERIVSSDGDRAREAGYRTTPKTKKFAIEELKKFIKSTGPSLETSTYKTCPYDYQFIVEAMSYTYTRIGGMQAEEGFDDCVIARALGQVAMRDILDQGISFSTVKRVELDPLERYCLRRAQGEAAGQYRNAVDDMMGRMF